jgi:hypothetical protein
VLQLALVTLAVLGLLGACGSSGGSGSSDTAAGTDPASTAAKRSVVDRTLPKTACPAPPTPPRQPTTTAVSPGRWPPLGYDTSALVRADVLSWSGGTVVLRWQPGQGTGVCTATLKAPVAWVLDSGGYTKIEGAAIGDFITQRKKELGATADSVPFLVEVSDDGTTALQLGEVPPG